MLASSVRGDLGQARLRFGGELVRSDSERTSKCRQTRWTYLFSEGSCREDTVLLEQGAEMRAAVCPVWVRPSIVTAS